MEFNAVDEKKSIVRWIADWFDRNGKDCNAVIGISGGKDSSVAAALCCEALGPERVIGVLMPNGKQGDINVAYALVKHLGIKHYEINIKDAFDAVLGEVKSAIGEVGRVTEVNLPPRLRMSALYAVSQSVNGRVVNTCNLSEDYVGYSTKYGDMAGDFSPLSRLTVAEVRAVGREAGLPAQFVDKVPIDGLCGKTDEENLGFTYEVLDNYIRTGVCEDDETRVRIDSLHNRNLFKLLPMECYVPEWDKNGTNS